LALHDLPSRPDHAKVEAHKNGRWSLQCFQALRTALFSDAEGGNRYNPHCL